MARAINNDLDYLAARLHGRRSRLAEAGRLEGLCRLPSLADLGRAIYPSTEFHAAPDLQRRLAQDLVWELSGFLKHLKGPGAELVAWMLVRFQVENIKVLLRGLMRRKLSGQPQTSSEPYLLVLPPELALDMSALAATDSLEAFIERLPAGAPRKSLQKALGVYHEQARPFFLEGALDQGYFEEFLARAELVRREDRELIQSLVFQEVDLFHLMLVARGRFQYELKPELLLPLHVNGSGISRERFSAMLAAADLSAVAQLAVGRVIEARPPEREAGEAATLLAPATLEALAWQRFLHLANRAFRRSHMGLGTVVGYVGIRRVEVANLITVSEGLISGMAAEAIRAHLLPRTSQ